MKITFFIGNGFDQSMNLRTSYKDFYEYLLSKRADSREEKNVFLKSFYASLQRDKEDDYSDWSDLEKRLGNFMKEDGLSITDCNIEEYKSFYTVLGNALSYYIKSEENRINYGDFHGKQMLEDIVSFLVRHSLISGDDTEITFIVFNYTSLFSKLLEKAIEVENNEKILKNKKIKIGSAIYVHGSNQDGHIVFGIGNAAAATVEGWDLLSDVGKSSVRSLLEKSTMIANDDTLKKKLKRARHMILQSDCFVAFGAAVGETDAMWWKQVGRSLLSNPRHSLRSIDRNFYLCKYEDPKKLAPDLNEYEDEIKKEILAKMMDPNINREKIKVIWKRDGEPLLFSKDLGVRRRENVISAIDYNVKKNKTLIVMPAAKNNIKTGGKVLCELLYELCADRELISKLSEEELSSGLVLDKLAENNGKKLIYYSCFGFENQGFYEGLSRLLSYQEDDLSSMHIDHIVLIIDVSLLHGDSSSQNDSMHSGKTGYYEKLEFIVRNIEWYVVEKLGNSWSEYFSLWIFEGNGSTETERRSEASDEMSESTKKINEHVRTYIAQDIAVSTFRIVNEDSKSLAYKEMYEALKEMIQTQRRAYSP